MTSDGLLDAAGRLDYCDYPDDAAVVREAMAELTSLRERAEAAEGQTRLLRIELGNMTASRDDYRRNWELQCHEADHIENLADQAPPPAPDVAAVAERIARVTKYVPNHGDPESEVLRDWWEIRRIADERRRDWHGGLAPWISGVIAGLGRPPAVPAEKKKKRFSEAWAEAEAECGDGAWQVGSPPEEPTPLPDEVVIRDTLEHHGLWEEFGHLGDDAVDWLCTRLLEARERQAQGGPAAIVTCDGTAHCFARRDAALMRYGDIDGREIRFFDTDDIEVHE